MVGRLGYWVLLSVQRWFAKKDFATARRQGAKLGLVLRRLDSRRRRQAEENLKLAFPEMGEVERAELVKRVYEHFGRVVPDFLTIGSRGPGFIDEMTSSEGLEHLDEALAEGKGVLLLGAHMGNWERGLAWMGRNNYKISVIYRSANDEGTDRLIRGLRESHGIQAIPRGDALTGMVEALKRGEIVGLLADQNADDAFVPFFGKPAGTVLGPGVIQARLKCPVIPFTCLDQGDGRFVFKFFPRLEPAKGASRGEGLMRVFHEWLEERIRETPEQWLWIHDRWRNARKRGLL